MKVLFIGNSHTYVHYVPLRTEIYCKENGMELSAIMLTQPGMGLDYHLNQSQTYFNLMYGEFDAVILQHKAHPFGGAEDLIENVKKFAAITPERTRIYLYMTWSEKDNFAGQPVMCKAYEKAAETVGAEICPVGKVWHELLTNHAEEEFYFRDGQHSSVLGASVAAVVIGNTLMDKQMTEEECFRQAKKLARYVIDSRMPDMK